MPPTEALNMIIVKNKLLDTTAYGLIKSKSNASLAGAKPRQWPINGVDDASPRPHWVNGERKVLRIDKRGASPSHSRKWESFWQLQSLFFAPFNSSFLHKREKLNTCFPIPIPISIFISMNRHNQVVIKVNTQAQTLTHLYLCICASLCTKYLSILKYALTCMWRARAAFRCACDLSCGCGEPSGLTMVDVEPPIPVS